MRLSAVIRSEGTVRRLEELGLGIATVAAGAGGGPAAAQAAGPQDAVVEFGAAAEAAREGPAMLARGGRLVFGSIDELPVALATAISSLVTRELQVRGTYSSTLADLEPSPRSPRRAGST